MKAALKNYRQAPRKVRLVADALRGKSVHDALATLNFAPNKAAVQLKKLVESAVANARYTDEHIDTAQLFVSSITVNKGMTMFRYMPKAFGRADRFRRESSHVNLVLGVRGDGTSFSEKIIEKKVEKKKVGQPVEVSVQKKVSTKAKKTKQ